MADEQAPGITDATAAPRVTIFDRMVCLAITVRKFGNHKKAAINRVQTEADKKLLALSKKLLDSEQLAAVTSVVGGMNDWLDSVSSPSEFKMGMRLVAIAMAERVKQELDDVWLPKFHAAVDAFLEVYPDQVRAIEARLADQYDPKNYPTVDDMRRKFDLRYQFVTFGVPGTLQSIKASLFEDEKRKHEAWIVDAKAEYRATLRARLTGFFDALAEALSPKSDGKKRKLYASTMENLNGALSLFEMQDATDDTDMAALVARGRNMLAGVDVEMLREDDALRASKQAELAALIADMKTLAVDRGTREVDLDLGPEPTPPTASTPPEPPTASTSEVV